MKKYGVKEIDPEEPSPEVKKEGERCPKCGALLEDTDETGVKICLTCGTEPFEMEEKK